MRNRLLWLALASLALPNPAEAALKDFLHYCSSGAIRTCASVQVETVAFKQGKTVGTEVWIRIRNLQGTEAYDNTRGSLITKVGLTAPDVGMASNLFVTHDAPARSIYASGEKYPGEYWSITDKPIGGPVEFSTGTTGVRGGILGCDASRANPSSYFQTCGDAGWITFHFLTSGSWTADQAEIAWGVQAVQVDDGSYQCRSGENCAPPPTEVVPEPATVILLGSGLAGLGMLRRRRREEEGVAAE